MGQKLNNIYFYCYENGLESGLKYLNKFSNSASTLPLKHYNLTEQYKLAKFQGKRGQPRKGLRKKETRQTSSNLIQSRAKLCTFSDGNIQLIDVFPI